MRGNEVLMVSGSDMHGTPTAVMAEKEGVTPDVIARRYHEINTKCMKDLGISFDLWFDTSQENHKKVVHELFLRLHEKGHITERMMLLPFCNSCSRFLPDRYVLGTCPHCGYSDARGDQCAECGKTLDPEELIDIRCKICGGIPEMRESKHLFFLLSAFREKLLDYIADKDYWKSNTLKFTRNWLEAGLKDRPITRDIKWGIDVPLEGYEGKKIYVWFEAVMGYLSASKEWARRKGDDSLWESFWKDPECRHYYFIGKDNIPFHTIIWPAMLMGIEGLNLPYDVPANEYMRLGRERFSKSKGVLVEIPPFLEKYDPDALRYYITMIMPEHRDAEFSWDEFFRKNNGELVATYGNFVNRVLTFAEKHFGAVPEAGEQGKVDEEFLQNVKESVNGVAHHLEGCKFQAAIKDVMAIAAMGNKYFDEKAPWDQVKKDKGACGTTINASLRAVKALAVATAPFLPFSSDRLWRMLGYDGSVHDQKWEEALVEPPEGERFKDIRPLFQKLEPEGAEDLTPVEEATETQTDKSVETESIPLYIRIGKVQEVKDHPRADKLYIIDVDLRDERRTLVAGLKNHYKPEELEGRKIAVLCNLKPAKLRGVESRGMLLAAESDGVVGVLFSDTAEPGDVVTGHSGASEISFDEFQKFRLEVVELDAAGGPKGACIALPDGETVTLVARGIPLSVDKDMKKGSRIR
jgi:methionyl-tRNA synthetase